MNQRDFARRHAGHCTGPWAPLGVADGTWQGGRRARLPPRPTTTSDLTTFVVVEHPHARAAPNDPLRGMFAYDAVSSDGRRLFVLQFPKGIDGGIHYVVRSVNLVTGPFEPGVIVDKTEPGERMADLPIARAVQRAKAARVDTPAKAAEVAMFVHASHEAPYPAWPLIDFP